MSRYLAFCKPFDVLSQFRPEPGSAARSLAQFVSVPGVYAAGRLDRDSEGLLLLTDDGALQHALTDPRSEHPRTYWAQVEGVITEVALAALSSGVLVQGRTTKPAAQLRSASPIGLFGIRRFATAARFPPRGSRSSCGRGEIGRCAGCWPLRASRCYGSSGSPSGPSGWAACSRAHGAG